jgi:hypothetical protein
VLDELFKAGSITMEDVKAAAANYMGSVYE